VRLTQKEKEQLTRELADFLGTESEVRKVVVFGSFFESVDPHDLDVAVFQDGQEGYLSLAMKYRKKTREIAQRIPLDIIPLKAGCTTPAFLSEVNKGVTVYEKRNWTSLRCVKSSDANRSDYCSERSPYRSR